MGCHLINIISRICVREERRVQCSQSTHFLFNALCLQIPHHQWMNEEKKNKIIDQLHARQMSPPPMLVDANAFNFLRPPRLSRHDYSNQLKMWIENFFFPLWPFFLSSLVHIIELFLEIFAVFYFLIQFVRWLPFDLLMSHPTALINRVYRRHSLVCLTKRNQCHMMGKLLMANIISDANGEADGTANKCKCVYIADCPPADRA